MRVRIGDEERGPGSGDLTDRFARWLAGDRTVGRHVTFTRVRSGTGAGGMSGAPLEWIGLALSTGFSAASLVYAHLGFRASLAPRERPGARMVVEHDGVRIVVEDGGPEDVARLARLLGSDGADPAPDPGSRPDGDTGGAEGGAP
ncbi:effector-associated constant component EACC1 [Streptomyces aculeolatus]